MNNNNREECGLIDALLWILCKLAAENRAMEKELDDCYTRIDALNQQLEK